MILRDGDTGQAVIDLQDRLHAQHYYSGVSDGVFGPQTRAAVRAFQAHRGLEIDGVAGPITLGALRLVCPDAPASSVDRFHDLICETAIAEDGVREEGGPNRGPRIEEYLRSVGLEPGNPWCMAFCFWTVEQAARRLGMPNPLIRTGACVEAYNWADDRGFLVEHAQRGDIGIMLFGNGKGHAFVITSNASGRYVTVEGNTNPHGSREGDGVYRRADRRWTQLAGVIRIPS